MTEVTVGIIFLVIVYLNLTKPCMSTGIVVRTYN